MRVITAPGWGLCARAVSRAGKVEGVRVLRHDDQKLGTDTVFGAFSIYDGDDIFGKSPVIDFFYGYWRALAAEGRRPMRADIHPSDLIAHLDRVVLMDLLHAGKDFRLVVRLIGTFVTNHYGEISGKDIYEMENKAAAKRIYHLCSLVLEKGAPHLSVTPAFAPDRKHKEGLGLYMPLYDAEGQIEKIMVGVDIRPLRITAMDAPAPSPAP